MRRWPNRLSYYLKIAQGTEKYHEKFCHDNRIPSEIREEYFQKESLNLFSENDLFGADAFSAIATASVTTATNRQQ